MRHYYYLVYTNLLAYMKKTILLIQVIFPCILFSQLTLRPGYIVKNNRDTLKGYIKAFSERQFNDQVFFTGNTKEQPIAYSPDDITGFGFDGENIFSKITYTHPYTFSAATRFAKMLVDGNYRLYTFFQKDRNFFVINTYEDSTYLLFDDVFSNNSGIVDEVGNYKNQLLFLSVPCDTLKGLIDDLPYNQTAIAKYVDRLNKCILPSEQNVIVYKKEKSYLHIYVYAGGLILGQNLEYTGRIIGRITVPALDRNVSINFGVNFMKYHREYLTRNMYSNALATRKIDRSLYSIPLTFQFDFTHGRIKPYIAAGLSLVYLAEKDTQTFLTQVDDNRFGIGFILAAGIEGYITKRLMIKADYNYELYFHYPTLGIGYFFK
jgi:hypothetical protein